MEKRQSLSLYLLFVLQSAVFEVRCLTQEKFIQRDHPLSDAFPSCVEVDHVWPPPHSVLKPFSTSHDSFLHYSMRITFSRPVGIEDLDTTGAYQQELSDHLFHTNERLFLADDVAPVFLSPSATNFTRYYPYRLKKWHGSDRTFMVYFVMSAKNARLELTDKVYLIIDGGRFYSYEAVGSQVQRVYVQTTILGEYYFEDYLKNHPEYKTKPAQPIAHSIYCRQQPRRPFFTVSDTQQTVEPSDASHHDLTVELSPQGHHLHIASSAFTGGRETLTGSKAIVLLLSLSTRGWGGRASIALPPTIKATYKGVNVTVRLNHQNITVKQPTSVPKLTVPVTRNVVYDLRERLYHNKEKVMTRRDIPVFAQSSLSSEPADRKLFPQTVILSKNQIVNIEVVDPVSKVKLRHYYSRSHFTGNTVECMGITMVQLPLPDLFWNEVTQNAPIATKSDRVRYPTVPDAFTKVSEMSKHSFRRDNHRTCLPNSKRNLGHYGDIINHVIEIGSMYHMLEPMDYSTWSVGESAMEAVLVTKGEKKALTVTSGQDIRANSFPPLFREALERYVCLLPPSKDVPRPTQGQNEQWVHLDECIFVPRQVAKSGTCGGLMLFKNITSIINDPNFCSKHFGDCVGLPIGSTKRFPVIPTYGLHEITGWVISSQELLDFQAHPVGSLLTNKPNYAMPRALLKYSKAHDTPESSLDRITLQFLPAMGPSSLLHYSVELSEGFTILSARIAVPDDDFCESVWQLQIEPPFSDTVMHRNAMLSATVVNTGEGGGDFVFDVKCSNQIIINPAAGVITTWIDSDDKATVVFVLSGNLASSASRQLHKCELSVNIKTEPELHSGIIQPSLCHKFIETFYGAFMDTCDYSDDLPYVDLTYYVLPMSELDSLTFIEGLNSTVGSSGLQLVRVITVSLDIPREEEALARALRELSIECGNANVFTLDEEQLSFEGISFIENPDYFITKKPLVYHSHFTKSRKVIFLANSDWDMTQEPSDCSITLKVSRPNWLCTQEIEVLKKLYVQLSELDIEAIKKIKEGPFSFLIPLYGPQSNGVMLSLLLCLVTTILLMGTTAITHLILYIYRNELPKKGTLQALQADMENAEKEDAEYWDNPQVYLVPGNEETKKHFVLHNFKATEPLDTTELKNIKIAGTLKYMVMFGHIKKVYVDSRGEVGDIWLQASSGMYLLPFENVAPDYQDELVKFLKANSINTEKLLNKHCSDEEYTCDKLVATELVKELQEDEGKSICDLNRQLL